MNEEIKEYERLLEEFNQLPEYYQDRTFMDIAGYPHYENVCSNILSFYFDPSAEHGMKDLLIQSFLDCAEFDKESLHEEYTTAKIDREVATKNNKRLDILIELDNLVIGIENKIWADLYNPLEEYDTLIAETAKDRKQVKVVLSINIVQKSSLSNGFINITYQNWIDQIQKVMGKYLLDANPKYLNYFFDFIKTIQRLGGKCMQNKEVNDFFKQHHETIKKLSDKYNSFLNDLGNEIVDVQGKVFELNKDLPLFRRTEKPQENESPCVLSWIYTKRDLVSDFILTQGVLAIDLWIATDGWRYNFWARTKNETTRKNLDAIATKLKQTIPELGEKDEKGVYLLKTFDLDTQNEEVAAFLFKSMQLIFNAVKELGIS